LAEIRAGIPEGRPLDTGTRHTLEGSFDVDLSAIRVHTGTRADYLARSVQADAFAAGPHLFFRADLYRPESDAGLWLLAHEVTHSIQQADGAHNVAARTCAAEVIADRTAARVLAGQPAGLDGRPEAVRPLALDAPLVIQRHGSWEHRLLGDASSVDLNDITQKASNRDALLRAVYGFLDMWRTNPDSANGSSEMLDPLEIR